MKKVKLLVLALAFILLGSCLDYAQGANILTKRMSEGFPNETFVYEHVYDHKTPFLQVSAVIPQIGNSQNSKWEAEFNQSLLDNYNELINEIEENAEKSKEYLDVRDNLSYELMIDYEVKLNQGGLLSLVVRSYYYTGGAHGMTVVDYFNVDLTTGHLLAFEDLYNTKQDLENVARIINEVVASEPERYFSSEFTSDLLQSDQDFYLQEDQVVVCFGLYELAPYASGIQEFAIPTP